MEMRWNLWVSTFQRRFSFASITCGFRSSLICDFGRGSVGWAGRSEIFWKEAGALSVCHLELWTETNSPRTFPRCFWVQFYFMAPFSHVQEPQKLGSVFVLFYPPPIFYDWALLQHPTTNSVSWNLVILIYCSILVKCNLTEWEVNWPRPWLSLPNIWQSNTWTSCFDSGKVSNIWLIWLPWSGFPFQDRVELGR